MTTVCVCVYVCPLRYTQLKLKPVGKGSDSKQGGPKEVLIPAHTAYTRQPELSPNSMESGLGESSATTAAT